MRVSFDYITSVKFQDDDSPREIVNNIRVFTDNGPDFLRYGSGETRVARVRKKSRLDVLRIRQGGTPRQVFLALPRDHKSRTVYQKELLWLCKKHPELLSPFFRTYFPIKGNRAFPDSVEGNVFMAEIVEVADGLQVNYVRLDEWKELSGGDRIVVLGTRNPYVYKELAN